MVLSGVCVKFSVFSGIRKENIKAAILYYKTLDSGSHHILFGSPILFSYAVIKHKCIMFKAVELILILECR